MGIPGFFGWLLRNYDKTFFTTYKINAQINELYIDANCLLHPSCFKVLNISDPTLHTKKVEDAMITQCIQDIDNLIKYVNPTDKIFLAVDGVAPLAKISQQRKRRYKSYSDTVKKNEIKKIFNKPVTHSWTNASITPGTEFMEKLHIKLEQYLRSLTTPKNIIYSSYHTPGEGEHKIFDHIRKYEDNVTRVVYGLDADLIFLAMACKKHNMFLIRETTAFIDQKQVIETPIPFVYVNIEALIYCFNELVYNMLENTIRTTGKQIAYLRKNNVDDIIFICYFLGNDFIPHLPSIDVKTSGMDMLLNAYVVAYTSNSLPLVITDNGKVQINVLFLNDFLAQLSIYEKEWFCCDKDAIRATRTPNYKGSSDPYDYEIWKLENMITIKSTDVFKKYIGMFDDWKFRYYEHYFVSSESQEQTIKNVCKNYIDGIMWIAKYYFGECPSWSWVYEYNCAPFVTDLNKFLQTYHYNVNNYVFHPDAPLQPITQLLCVIPKAYSYLLPEQYAELMQFDSQIGDMFPDDFDIDVCNKNMYWQCIPILPYLNIDRVIASTKKIKQTPEMAILNNISEHLIIVLTR